MSEQDQEALIRRLMVHGNGAMAKRIILVVDDEPLVLHYIRRVLEGSGYNVLRAADGEEALRLCEQLGDKLSMVVSDISMPRMGGREFAKCVGALPNPIPVVLMSGYTSGGPVLDGLKEGRVDSLRFLRKPFLPKDLLATVSEVIG